MLGYGSATLLLGVGMILQYGFSVDAALGRSGAVIVVVGVFFTWKDVRGRFSRAERSIQKILDHSSSDINYRPKSGKMRDRQILAMEASIISVGTLTWGFGDLHLLYYLSLVFSVFIALYLLNRLVDGKY